MGWGTEPLGGRNVPQELGRDVDDDRVGWLVGINDQEQQLRGTTNFKPSVTKIARGMKYSSKKVVSG